jgi:NADH:ubiquinone oxidoreductase subunit 4 (subunit M)
MSGREWATLLPLVILMFAVGLYPRPIIDRIEPSAQALIQRANTVRPLGSAPALLPEQQAELTTR